MNERHSLNVESKQFVSNYSNNLIPNIKMHLI